jgi:hypothetical protein
MRYTLRVHCGNGQIENIWSGNEMSEAIHFEAIAIKHWGRDNVWICDNIQEIIGCNRSPVTHPFAQLLKLALL